MTSYRVSLIEHVSGRVIETFRFDTRGQAEADVIRLCKLADEDTLVVFEVTSDED